MTAAELTVGPVLRRIAGDRATIWVETSAPADVQVRAGQGYGRARTFTAYGHHYALVVVAGLPRGAATPYQVLVNEAPAWPEPDSDHPPSVIRTRPEDDDADDVRLVFGSCREGTQKATGRRFPPDALDAFSRRLAATGEPWPDTLVLLGDQVYADETSPRVHRWLRARRRRRPDAPDTQVVTFEEYTRLYWESWRDREIRWLLSTVPSVMIFDDHEIIDDWNTSGSWRATMQAQPWWSERISSGLASYWVYQHLGNLHPDELANDPTYRRVIDAGEATEVLRDFGAMADSEADVGHDPARWRESQYSWSYRLDVGRTRVIVLDTRCSRVLEERQRAMLPDGEWRWFVEQARGRYDHLVLGSSLPWLLPPGLHHLESWNEQLVGSPRPWVATVSERIRRGVDLEHWAAFHRSFESVASLFRRLGGATPDRPPASGEEVGGVEEVGAGGHLGSPLSISVLSGDVHHSYIARADLGPDLRCPVHQLTCSPLHNQVPAPMRPLMRFAWSRAAASMTRTLARAAGVRPPSVRWTRLGGPYFGNAIATLIHSGHQARVEIEGTTKDGRLRSVVSAVLSGTAGGDPVDPAGDGQAEREQTGQGGHR